MTLTAPFPYFGGKRRAAPAVWDALGDVGGYVEPFAGSAAVLLARPATKGRRVETLNDADGWLVNVWRSIQLNPAAVAQHRTARSLKSTTTRVWRGCRSAAPPTSSHGSKATPNTTTRKPPDGGCTSPRAA